MIVRSKVTSEPATEPVTAAEAKTHLRVTSSDDDTYITTLIKVARQLCESYAGLSFITQTRQIKLDSFPAGDAPIRLSYGPVSAVGTFTYLNDAAGTTTMVAGTDYTLDIHSEIPRLVTLDSWPTDLRDDTPHRVVITYTAGYGSASDVPAIIKQAILMQIGSLYENRQDEGSNGTVCWSSAALLDTVKVYHNAWQD